MAMAVQSPVNVYGGNPLMGPLIGANNINMNMPAISNGLGPVAYTPPMHYHAPMPAAPLPMGGGTGMSVGMRTQMQMQMGMGVDVGGTPYYFDPYTFYPDDFDVEFEDLGYMRQFTQMQYQQMMLTGSGGGWAPRARGGRRYPRGGRGFGMGGGVGMGGIMGGGMGGWNPRR